MHAASWPGLACPRAVPRGPVPLGKHDARSGMKQYNAIVAAEGIVADAKRLLMLVQDETGVQTVAESHVHATLAKASEKLDRNLVQV